MVLELIFQLAPEERTRQRPDDPMVVLVPEDASADASCRRAEEAALAFLRVVRVGGVFGIAVGVRRVAAGRGTLAPGLLLRGVVGLLMLLLAVLRLAVLWRGAVLRLGLAVVVSAVLRNAAVCAGLLRVIGLCVVRGGRSTITSLLAVRLLAVSSLLAIVLVVASVALLLLWITALLRVPAVAALVATVRHVEGCDGGSGVCLRYAVADPRREVALWRL